MRTGLSITGFALLALLPACVSYEPHPLDTRAELASLAERHLPDAVAMVGFASAHGDQPAVFDPSDGLDEDEAVSVALTLNTDLQAARATLGESESLLIKANMLPNPEVGVGVLPGFAGTPGFVVDAAVLFELLRPGERSARVGVALARGDATRAEILAAEYRLATDVRRQLFAVLVAGHVAALFDEETALRERAVEFVRRRRAIGEANDLEVSAAELEMAELKRDRRLAVVALQSARIELNRVMGLPPGYEVRLTDSGKPLTVMLFDDPSDAQLQERLSAGRLDLRAMEAMYRIAEEDLRLAVSKQYPKISIGPSYQHEGVSQNYIGVGVAIELPIFDRNQGEIAEKDAARERVRAEYVALLHRLTAEAFAARAKARAARLEIHNQEDEVLPLLRRSEELYRGAFEARELNVLDWIAAQQRGLRTRRAYLESLVSYRQAMLDLDAATGLAITKRPSRADARTPSPTTELPTGQSAQE